MSWFEGGEVFRSGFTSARLRRMFYFVSAMKPSHLPSSGGALFWRTASAGSPTVDMPFPKTHGLSLSPIAPKDFDLHKVGIVKVTAARCTVTI